MPQLQGRDVDPGILVVVDTDAVVCGEGVDAVEPVIIYHKNHTCVANYVIMNIFIQRSQI